MTYMGEVHVAFPGERMRPMVNRALQVLCGVPEGLTVAETFEEVAQQVGRGFDRRPTVRDEEFLVEVVSMNADLFEVVPLDDGDLCVRLKPIGAIKRQLREGDTAAPTLSGTATDGAGRTVQVLFVPVRAQHSERSLKDFTGQAAERQRAIRNLALAYDRYLVRRKHLTLAHRFRLYDGSELRSDLYDRTDNRLFAVAANSNRAEIRHALAHLCDCGRFLGRPGLAVLAPDRPDPDLLALVRHMGADFIYLNAGGSFIDSGSKTPDMVAAAAPGFVGRTERHWL